MSSITSDIPEFSGDPTGAAAIFAGNPAVPGIAPASNHDIVLTRLNSLLRGEISAAETYRNALAKAADHNQDDRVNTLQEVQNEHVHSCNVLRERIVELGGEPSDSSGAWGVWAQMVQQALSLFGGDRGAIVALREGEQHGLTDYQAALNDVDVTSAQIIQNQLIPAQERHLDTLLKLQDKMTSDD